MFIKYQDQAIISVNEIIGLMRNDQVVMKNISANRYHIVFMIKNSQPVLWIFKDAIERNKVFEDVCGRFDIFNIESEQNLPTEINIQ